MKRIFSMLMAVTMLMCAVGFAPISAQAREFKIDDPNEFEIRYDISYYSRDGEKLDEPKYNSICNMEELKFHYEDNEEIMSKYDSEYFDDHTLFAIDCSAKAAENSLRVTEIGDEGFNMYVALTEKSESNGLPSGNQTIFITVDGKNSARLLDIAVQLDITPTKDEVQIGGPLFDPDFDDMTYFGSHVIKIGSVDEWKNWYSYDKYDESFFEDNFIIAVTWYEGVGVMNREISSVLLDGDNINITLRNINDDPIGPDVVRHFHASLVFPREYGDKNISVESVMSDGERPLFASGLSRGGAKWVLSEGSLTVGGNGTFNGSLPYALKTSVTHALVKDGITEIGEEAFSGCINMTGVELPDSITRIDKGAFSRCKALTGVEIPESVSEIGEFAFSQCQGITIIYLPNNVTEITKATFYGCTSLKEIHIPDSIKSIGEYAFASCYTLTDIYYDGTKSQWESIINDPDEWEGVTIHYGSPDLPIVTVKPPTVNLESGEVPYGSKVTISPTDGNDFMYSVNGEQFINSRLTNTFGDAVITITEDTVLVVRSMIDVVEPDTEYIFPEVTYTYTIGGCVIPPEYPYTINSIKLVSESGEEYDAPPADKSFIVDVDITEIVNRSSKDYFIVAVYDTNGALISMNYIKADLPANASFSCGVNISKTDKTIGSIKVFVWDALGSMETLAESKSLTFTAQ